MTTLVITRHPGLVQYLLVEGLVSGDCEIRTHASESDVKGKDVWGVLPHNLSCLCNTFTEIPLNIPAELRGAELSEEQVRQFAGKPVTYKVTRL